MPFLQLNNFVVPVEVPSASMSSSVRKPKRALSGKVLRSGFGVGRVWSFKTSFLTMEEARILRVLFTGYLPGFEGVQKTHASWGPRGAPEITNDFATFPAPYLAASGEFIGGGTVKCEGRLVGTEWVTKTIAVMDLELYEVGISAGGFTTSVDASPRPGPGKIPDPTPGGGGGTGGGEGDGGFEQLPFVEPARNPNHSYITGVPYGPIYGEPGPFYDSSGNEIAAYGGDAPSEGVYYANGSPAYNRVRQGSYGGNQTLTRDPAREGWILNFGKAFTGPGEVSFKYMVDTNPYQGGLTVYAEGDTVGYRMLLQQRRQGEGTVSMILSGSQVWRVFFGFIGENPDFPSGLAGENTFHIWDLKFEPSAIDPDQQAPSVGDEQGERNDWANTVPSGKTNLGWGFFSSVGDTLKESRSGKTYTSTHAFIGAFDNYWTVPNGMTPGSVAILRKRLSGPGSITFQTSITAFANGVQWRLTARVANLVNNFTFAMRTQERIAQFERRFDVCGGTPEFQVIAEMISGTPQGDGNGNDTRMSVWVSDQLFFAEGAGHGPALHSENPYPAPDSDGDGVPDEDDPYPYDPELDGVPNPDNPDDRDNPAIVGVPEGMTAVTDGWFYDPTYYVPFEVIPGGFRADQPDTGYFMVKRYQGPGLVTFDLASVGTEGYFGGFWQTSNKDYQFGYITTEPTRGYVELPEDRVYDVMVNFYASTPGQSVEMTNIVFTPY